MTAMSNFLEELKEYFENTPKEEILKAWAETAEFEGVGITVEELLSYTGYSYILPDDIDIGSSKITSLHFSPEFSSGFFITNKISEYAKFTPSRTFFTTTVLRSCSLT
jgi:hypothetical protein